MIRKIKSVVTGNITTDGAGVKLLRILDNSTTKNFDPFLMLDAFDSTQPSDYTKGFPFHPHRGIETITYLIEGKIEHKDSLGNEGVISDGSCQWMIAGSGIIHQEMPIESKHLLGVQLWLNLPAKDKMTKPQYHDLQAHMIPKIREEDGTVVSIIAGHHKTVDGPTMGDFVKVLFLDVDVKPGATWYLKTEHDDTLFIYIVEGKGWFDGTEENPQISKRAVLFKPGDEFVAKASNKGVRFLLLSAKALNEPIAWGGPIVMNTHKELQLAFEELEDGTFIKG